MPQCIYCLKSKLSEDFNREHVVPEAFGGFIDSLVLHEAVCRDCNSVFGDSIDLVLARGTDEGLQRYQYDVKPPEQVDRFRYDALTFIHRGEGEYKGCLLRLIADVSAPGGFRAEPIDQVGFASPDGGDFKWIPLSDVYSGEWKERQDLDPDIGVKIYARDHASVRSYLAKEGIGPPKWRPLVPGAPSGAEIDVWRLSEITIDVRRVMAKIAFNYLTYVHSPDFALRPEFDMIRRFVRFGEEPGEFVSADGEEILPQPPGVSARHRVVAHIVTVEHAVDTEAVIAQVSLFGGLRYQVLLSAEDVPDLVYSGHLFNVADRRVIGMGNRRQAAPGEPASQTSDRGSRGKT